MEISLKPSHLKRYADIARLLLKYGRGDMVETAGLPPELQAEMAQGDGEATTHVAAKANELAEDLQKLGPTFIKLGQLLSTRAEFLPPAYIAALAKLQDNVEPFSFQQVEEIVSAELGFRLSKGFSHFESQPLGAASLGQVHRAAMLDGRAVVVKVQRPGIREIIAEDMEALEEIAAFMDQHTEWGRRYGFATILDEFRRSLWRELDYRQEARNLVTLATNLI